MKIPLASYSPGESIVNLSPLIPDAADFNLSDVSNKMSDCHTRRSNSRLFIWINSNSCTIILNLYTCLSIPMYMHRIDYIIKINMHFKKNKIILINPPILLEERYGKDLKNFGAISEPLGLAYLAANLEKNNYKVSIIDSLALGLTIIDVVKKN